MMFYVQGQDLWKVVGGSETTPSTEDSNVILRKWRMNTNKTMFGLKTTISIFGMTRQANKTMFGLKTTISTFGLTRQANKTMFDLKTTINTFGMIRPYLG